MKKVFAILLFAGLIGLGALAWASQSAPGWYVPVDPYDPEVATLAETVEYRVAEELTKVRADSEPWGLRVRDEQVNAWLASRLPEWMAHDGGRAWPDEVGTPQIKMGANGIDVAMPVAVKGTEQIVVTRLQPTVQNGKLRLKVDRVGLGRLTLPGKPAGKMMEMLERYAPGGMVDERITNQILSSLPGAASVDDFINLPDGRRIELMKLIMENGSFDLTSRTLPPTGP